MNPGPGIHETIRQKTQEIRRVLGLPIPRQQLPGELTRDLHRLLEGAACGQVTARSLQERIRSGRPDRGDIFGRIINNNRDYLLCLMLLEKAYLVQPGTQASQVVIHLAQEAYSRARPHDRSILEQELRDRLRSSHASIRQVAARILEPEPVTAEEVSLLAEPLGFVDVQYRIAQRILRQRQRDYFAPWLAFLFRLVREADSQRLLREAGCGSPQELLNQATDFGIESVLQPIFSAYQEYFDHHECRGILLFLLTGIGEVLVPLLEPVYRSKPLARTPILRLLQQMVPQGVQGAVELLRQIALNPAYEPDFPHHIAPHLFATARDLAERGNQTIQARRALQMMRSLAETLSQVGNSPIRVDVGQRILNLPTQNDPLTLDFIRRAISHVGSEADRRRVRKSGREGWDLLVRLARDPGEGLTTRLGAVDLLMEMAGRSQFRQAGLPVLWELYLASAELPLRLAAVEALAQFGSDFPKPEAMLIRLEADSRTAEPDLRTRITENWSRIFPAPKPGGNIA